MADESSSEPHARRLTGVQFRTISGAGQNHVVSQAGDGPDVVLLHGFPDTPPSWTELETSLVAAGWRVTVPWLRGYHPETIVAGRPFDAETLGRDALALLDAIGAERAVLVGHDWGALIAYSAAALAPERIRVVVPITIPHPSVLKRTPASLWAVRHFFALKLPRAADRVRRHDFAYLDELYTRWAPDWSGPEREQSLGRAKQAFASPQALEGALDYYRAIPLAGRPALLAHPPAVPGLIVGANHDLVAPELFEQTAALMPAPSRALIVNGAGHWPHRERADVVLPEILDFLSGLEAP
jgi:pimeloyl-ACP methyl ester carboxylesterase